MRTWGSVVGRKTKSPGRQSFPIKRWVKPYGQRAKKSSVNQKSTVLVEGGSQLRKSNERYRRVSQFRQIGGMGSSNSESYLGNEVSISLGTQSIQRRVVHVLWG